MIAAVPMINSEMPGSSGPSKRTGLALYTIRDAMSKDPAATLAAAAETGYDRVESADHREGRFYGMKPKDFGKLVKKMECCR